MIDSEIEMDEKLKASGVFFLPWVGEKYQANAPGPRLLILGESHYSTEEGETPDLTRRCVSEHAARTWNHKFFTMLTQLVTGIDHWEIDRQAFWGKVCFYNYVQRSVADSWGVAPTSADFSSDEFALRAVIESLRPTHVLACSWRLWDNLLANLFAKEPYMVISDRFQIWRTKTQPETLAMGIPHPTRASQAPVTEAIKQFILQVN